MARPKDDTQNVWADRLRRAQKFKEDDFLAPFQVEKARAYYEGRQQAEGWSKNDWITINKIYSHIQAQLPTLYSLDPYFYVKLKRSFTPNPLMIALFERRAEIRQAYLNYLKGETKLKQTARLSIQDAHFDFGVLKIHYAADFEDNPERDQPILGDDEQPLVGEDGEPMMQPDRLAVNERYNVTRVHPDDFVWDDDAGPLESKWNWIAERVRLTPEEARQDETIDNSALEGLQTSKRDQTDKDKDGNMLTGVFSRSTQLTKDKGDEVFVFWEIYDLKNRQWLKVSEEGHKPLMKPTDLPPGVEDHPYAILRFTLRPSSAYPIPPISQALDPQREYNELRSKIMRHRKRFNRKYEAVTTQMEDPDEEIAKLEVGDDGTVVRTRAIGTINPIQDAPLDPTNYRESAVLNEDLTEMFGTPGSSLGVADADSATEAALLDKRLEIREGDRVALVTDWIKEVARKLDQLVQAHITRDEAVRITGPSGEFWQLVRTSDFEAIEGEFEYTVNVGATIPRLPQVERAQWLAFLQVVAGFPHLLTSKRLMTHMAELHHLEDEAMIDELMKIGQQILGGQTPMPGGKGSQSGVPEDNPITKILGTALGDQGGNTNNPTAPE